MSQPVNSRDRFNSRARRCPICGGWDGGNPDCSGYIGSNPDVVFCGSSQFAGALSRDKNGNSRHWIGSGECKCGVTHLQRSTTQNGKSNMRTPPPPPPEKEREPKLEEIEDWQGGPPPEDWSWEWPSRWKVEEVFHYKNADGSAAFDVLRILTGQRVIETGKPHKTIRQRHKTPAGKYIYRVPPELVVPYRLPQLVEADPKLPVIIAEGEPKVKALVKLGFVATCNPMGAGEGKWRDIFSRMLTGRTVFIWPDNDQTGLDHAQSIKASLERAGATAFVLTDLAAALPPKGDVVDWLKVPGNDAAKLQAELGRVEEANRPPKHRYHESELETIPPVEWLLEPFIQDRALNMLSGPSGTGKSYIALNWAKELARKYNVLYIAVEDYYQYPERIKAWNQYYNFAPKDGKFYLETLEMNLTVAEDADRIIKENDDIKPRFVVIDTYAAATAGSNENDNGQIELILTNAKKFIREWGCAILLIHHFNKAETAERGGSALKAGIVQALQVTTEQDSVKISMDKLRNTEKQSDFFYNFEKVEITVTLSDGTTRVRNQRVPVLSEHATTNMTELTPSQEAILNYLGAVIRRDNEHRPVDLETALGQARRTMSDNLAKLKSMKLVSQSKDRGPYKITREGLMRIGYISDDLKMRIEDIENW